MDANAAIRKTALRYGIDLDADMRDAYKVKALLLALSNLEDDYYFTAKLRCGDDGLYIDLDAEALILLLDFYASNS